MKKTLLTLSYALSVMIAIAQNGFTTYTASLGLSGISLKETALLKDNGGNTWIGFGTNDPNATVGLIKHNGTTWTVYSTTTTPALPSNFITALAKDNGNNIWIGTKAGLVKFDGTNFTNYTTTNGLPGNIITCIEVVGTQVYVGTLQGLSRFDGTAFTNYNVANGKLPNDSVTSIKSETSTSFWLGGNSRLVQFNINSTYSTTSFINQSITNSCGNLNCIYIDGSNYKWIATSSQGLLRYNGTLFENANSLYEIHGAANIPNTVYDISNGINNGTAISTIKGIIELGANGKVFEYFSSNLGNYIESNGAQFSVSQSGSAFTTGAPIIYYSFDKTFYEKPLTKICADNLKSLDINNVKAGITNIGDMHWNVEGASGGALYEVPKGSGKHTNFASSLWIGGLDYTSQLHGDAQTYRQSGIDFWPGPLDTTTAITYSLSAKDYDKIWKISYTDINAFISNFNSGNVQNGNYTPTEDILTWPAKGTGNYSRSLAPFVDVNNNGIYDPITGGDYPKIKGDQALYFIFNDRLYGSMNQSSGCVSMGIEVHAMAYAYGCPSTVANKPELTYTTFYDYKIINRSAITYNNVYVSMWSDIDLGAYNDDYIGCNVADNYGYGYNADGVDYPSTGNGYSFYGNYPPAQGMAIIKSPSATADGIDNNNDGNIDELGEEIGMTKFTYFNNFLGPQGDPNNCGEYRKYMTGLWKDGTPFTCGGNGYGGSVPNNFVYPGDVNGTTSSDPANVCGNWTEVNAANTPGDRSFIMSSGPFTFLPNQTQEIEYAFVTSFDSVATTNRNLASVAKLKTDIQKVKNFYHQSTIPNCLQAITIGVKEILKQDNITIYPNPSSDVIYIKHNVIGEVIIHYEITDVLGKTILSSETSKNEFIVNTNQLKTGIYFIRLTINNSSVVKKLIKE